MKHIVILMLLAVATITNGQQIIHDKDAEPRQVGDFDAIEASSAIELRLSSGNENAVAVSASTPEHRAAIKTEVRGGVLKIWYESKKWFRNSGRVRVYVSAKSLERLEASGACDIIVSGELKSDELSIRLSGASDFKGAVRAASLSIELSGASDVSVKGDVQNLNVEASGASHFKGYDLKTDNCIVEASGASDIKITVNKVLNARASGASTVHYQGDGMVSDLKVSGASNISRKG
jgi:hypothetical protein